VEEEVVYRTFEGDDEKAVKRLVESIFCGFLGGKYWKWKYLDNPFFHRELLAVAEVKGEVVGCNHWLLRDFKVSRSILDKGALAADVAVRPDYRGKGLGSGLLRFLRSSNIVKNGHVAFIYMFADPDLAKKFHAPAAEYVLAPDGTVQYTKVLSWKKVKQNIDLLNKEIQSGKFCKKLSNRDLRVLFRMSAAPTLCIHVKKDGVSVDNGENLVEGADIVVSGDLSVFDRIKLSRRRKWSVIKAMLTGRLKVKVKLTKIFSLFDVLWIFEEVFTKKMT
jgi:predicted N-acetyltransferase YhbS